MTAELHGILFIITVSVVMVDIALIAGGPAIQHMSMKGFMLLPLRLGRSWWTRLSTLREAGWTQCPPPPPEPPDESHEPGVGAIPHPWFYPGGLMNRLRASILNMVKSFKRQIGISLWKPLSLRTPIHNPAVGAG